MVREDLWRKRKRNWIEILSDSQRPQTHRSLSSLWWNLRCWEVLLLLLFGFGCLQRFIISVQGYLLPSVWISLPVWYRFQEVLLAAIRFQVAVQGCLLPLVLRSLLPFSCCRCLALFVCNVYCSPTYLRLSFRFPFGCCWVCHPSIDHWFIS